MKFLAFLRDWSEVWALLIPLLVIIFFRPRGPHLKWVFLYVAIAFILNFLAIFTIEFYDLVPDSINYGNNIFYNLHSFIMVTCLGSYIIAIRKFRHQPLLRGLIILYILFAVLNFTFWEPVYLLSTRHFTTGSIVLLIVCLYYFLRSILDESPVDWIRHPSFLICSGVCLYQATTFFIFLFIYPLYDSTYNKDLSFAFLMMRIYQAVFVIFCVLLALSLYRQGTRGKKSRASVSS